MVKSINVIELKAKLDGKSEIILIDCREQGEWDEGHIPSAQFIPLSQFQQLYSEKLKNKDAEIYIQCRSGRRSLNACQILEENGYSNLTNVNGGILDWISHDFELD